MQDGMVLEFDDVSLQNNKVYVDLKKQNKSLIDAHEELRLKHARLKSLIVHNMWKFSEELQKEIDDIL